MGYAVARVAAFIDSCWVTELEDTKKPYESLSKMRNVKQRDFEVTRSNSRPHRIRTICQWKANRTGSRTQGKG